MDLLTFLLGIGAILFIFSIAGIILYIIGSLGLYQISKNLGLEFAWFAFIPVLQLYLIGKIVGTVKILNYEVPSLEIAFPCAALISAIFGDIDFIGPIIWLAYFIFAIIVFLNFFKKFNESKAVLMTVLSFILPFMFPIYLYMLRNTKPAATVEVDVIDFKEDE